MEEPKESSNTTPSSPQQHIVRDLRTLHEAGWIILRAFTEGGQGYEVSIPLLGNLSLLVPPQSQAQ